MQTRPVRCYCVVVASSIHGERSTDCVLSAPPSISSLQGSGQQVKAFKTLRLFRLAKLLRLARVRRIIKRWEESIGSLMSIVKLIFLLFVTLFMTHVIACCYYLLGNDEDGQGWAVNPHMSLGQDEADLWIKHNDTVFYKYIRTYYWGVGLVSSSARGDIKPQTDGEIIFVILCEVIGCVACGIILGCAAAAAAPTTSDHLLTDPLARHMGSSRFRVALLAPSHFDLM